MIIFEFISKNIDRVNEQPTEYKVALFTLISPIVAFIYGYKYLKFRYLIVASILAFITYFISILFFSWDGILKLNMICCISYLIGVYPFKLNKILMLFIKGYVSFAIFLSPIYVINTWPSSILGGGVSLSLIILSQYLIWFGKVQNQ